MLTVERLREALAYNTETGSFTWKIRPSLSIHIGNTAGYLSGGHKDYDPYWQITLDAKRYYAHRLAWFYIYGMWPKGRIDHKDRNQLNNAISNLREATRSQNQANSKTKKNNLLGLKGVCKSWKGLFKARIYVNGKYISLGKYETAEEASTAYWQAAKTHF